MSRLTKKSQVTMPKRIRKALGVGPGDEIEFTMKNHQVLLRKKKPVIDKYKGLLGQGTTEEVMEELR